VVWGSAEARRPSRWSPFAAAAASEDECNSNVLSRNQIPRVIF